jgi:hypothetical protein
MSKFSRQQIRLIVYISLTVYSSPTLYTHSSLILTAPHKKIEKKLINRISPLSHRHTANADRLTSCEKVEFLF